MYKCILCTKHVACVTGNRLNPTHCGVFDPIIHKCRAWAQGQISAADIAKLKFDIYCRTRGTGRTYNKLGQAVEMAREFPDKKFYFIVAGTIQVEYAFELLTEHWGKRPKNLWILSTGAGHAHFIGGRKLRSMVFIDHFAYESLPEEVAQILAYLK